MKSLRLLAFLLCLILAGCTAGEVLRSVRAAASGDPTAAARIAGERAVRYAANPNALVRDLNRLQQTFEDFRKIVAGSWGEKRTKEPSPTVYVKYTQNYESRASVDFDSGVVMVETLAAQNPLTNLKNAVTTTLLTPDDPRAVDLFSDQEVKISGTPFLQGEVQDQHGRMISTPQQAEAFADYLVKKRLQSKSIHTPKGSRTLRYVQFNLVKDHLQVRAQKYAPIVRAQAKRFNVSENLIFAIMQVESDFNPFAVSSVGAIGLMQVVPASAGEDVYAYLNGKSGRPNGDALLAPQTNILYGTAYLHLLQARYLAGVRNPTSREYCVIAAYNTGAGNTLRTFSRNRDEALQRVNGLDPLNVYKTLRSSLPYEETRRYLLKVMSAKKQFINL